jgi:hypothetical protein
MSCQQQLARRFLIIREEQCYRYKEARLQSKQEVKEEEPVLTSNVLELLRQFSVFLFQGEEAPTNLR